MDDESQFAAVTIAVISACVFENGELTRTSASVTTFYDVLRIKTYITVRRRTPGTRSKTECGNRMRARREIYKAFGIRETFVRFYPVRY